MEQMQAMGEERAKGINLTLSQMALEEMTLVANAKGIPLATHIRMIVESHHESPSYKSLVERAKVWSANKQQSEGGSDGTE